MAAGDTALGNGLVLVVPGTFAAPILGIDHSGADRTMIDVSTITTTGGKVFIGGLQYDPGELVVHCQMKSTEVPPMTETVGTVTITFLDTAVFTAEGAVSGFSAGMPMEDVMTIDVTVKLSSTITMAVPG